MRLRLPRFLFGRLARFCTLLLLALLPAIPAAARPAHEPPAPGGFLSLAASGDALDIALAFLRSHAAAYGLEADDLRDIIVTDRYTSQHNGVTHLYLRQRINGIAVAGGDINANVMPDGRILSLGSRFLPRLAARVNASAAKIAPADAVRSAAAALGLSVAGKLVQSAGAAPGSYVVGGANFAQNDVPVRPIYVPRPDGQVRLAWDMEIQPAGSADYWHMSADALTGQVLARENWTHSEHFDTANNGAATGSPRAAAAQPAPNAAQPDTYAVFATPLRNPLGGARTEQSAPADALASPFGWHDVNGAAGADFTSTWGNNAQAYADIDGVDGFSGGDFLPDGGASRVFTAALDLSQAPSSYRAAATTNLFYWTNTIHDLMYHYGFDEAAGNFQQNTYGRGGTGGDSVRAEAQDSGGRNNANFFTPPDGMQPRMQMYLWNGPTSSLLRVVSPAGVAGDYIHGVASFGPNNFAITDTLVLVNDGVGTITDGCDASFSNAGAVAGHIAVIDRGNCQFAQKVQNAQNNGAIGVIIVNNQPSGAPGMGVGSVTPTIPALSMTQSDGDAIKRELGSGAVTATLQRSTAPDLDGSLDSEIVIHEYAHGISNRLTGGPQNSSCVSNQETGSEGWSDFIALALTPKPSDTRSTDRALGAYAVAALGDLRRYPYSTNLATNPLTYGALAQPGSGGLIGEVHDVGEVWAAMLWEMYWNLIDDHGFSADLRAGTAGNNRAIQLVIDGMKMQPCQPSFVESRDAILAADRANYAGTDECRIWQAFARRGLGYSADAGSNDSVTDGTEAFDVPPACGVKIDPPRAELCAPNSAQLDVALGPLFDGAVSLSASNLPAGLNASFGNASIARPSATTLTLTNSAAVTPGIYSFQVQGSGAQSYASTVELTVSQAEPAAVTPQSPTNGAAGQPLRPGFGWSAAANAFSYQFELAADAQFASVVYSTTLQSTQLALPRGLSAGETYFWRVRALNGCGTATSSAQSFTVGAVARTLLVDDDADNPNVRTYFTAALDSLNISYDVWDTAQAGEPDAATLANYATVLWAGGHYGSPAAATELALASFLDGGGCLVISSQEYFYNNGLTPFMQQYLGVATATGDVGHAQVTGAGAVFGGLGPYTLDPTQIDVGYAATDSDIITPTLSAELAFSGSKGNAGVAHDGGRFRSIYMGFSLEAITSAGGRKSVLQKATDWCNALPLAITSAAPPAAKVGTFYSHQFTATGVPKPTFSLTAGKLPPGLTLSASGLLSGVPTRAGTYSGLVVSASNGQNPSATQSFTLVVARDGRVFVPIARR